MKLQHTCIAGTGLRLRLASAALLLVLAGGALSPALAQTWLINPPAELGRECAYGDCQNGFGILEVRTELGTNRYEGTFRDGEFHGHGRYEIMVSRSEQAYYDGDWVMGVREGRGTYWNGVSSLYVGQWRDDLRHGHGAYFFGVQNWTPNKHSEQWLQNNVENYTGEFVDDLYQGYGTYRWPDGERYEGEFYANEKHGNGTFFYSTGTRREQYWQYGRFIR
ncbi:MAG: hypothetical protein CMQ34_00765 [Gammaproteobacteria bacterium]|nr:hypothetical protein [Gammaproteobacteria bacterium]|tara:strand:+ start:730 stop:1392 length:663 start_codon:yes stop_codon:yes gene_type:complete